MDSKEQEFQSRLLATFKVEAAEHIQALSSGLIQLENAPGPHERVKIIETIFRGAHSLKGAARAVNMARIESICQSAESVFSALKRNELVLSPSLFDALHEAVDDLAGSLPLIGSESPDKGRNPVATLLRRLDSAAKGAGAAFSNAQAQTAVTAQPQLREGAGQAAPDDKPMLADTVRIARTKLDSLLFQAEELLSAKLTASQRVAEIRETTGALALMKKQRARIAPAIRAVQQACEREVKRDAGDQTQAQLRKVLEFTASEAVSFKSLEARLAALAKSAEHDQRALTAMVDGLLEDIKKASMLPISSALEMLPKMARDLARDQGKEVELIVSGGEIEIDRRILEEMRDPLIHLLRNCVDHGIETPAARRRANKPPRGALTLAITPKDGSTIEILVADDGAGIDTAKVREAARALGAATAEDLDARATAELLPLVFRSGISTSAIITDLSGRGLGLAIVEERVNRLGGTVTVASVAGQGTTFHVVLPLTLATFRGIHVRVNGEQFLLPTTHVEQVLRLRREVIKTVENRETIPWNGKAVALVRLADVLEMPRKHAEVAGEQTVRVVILSSADTRIAFWVDEIVGEQEVLAKPLGKQLARVRNIAGASVLGNGKTMPILNVADLLRSAVKAAAVRRADTAPGQEAAPGQKSILVAEDSITARTLLKNILEFAGYRVAAAVDGMEAYTLLETERFDLVVSDVEMPRMDGFDLTQKIRSSKAFPQLPVVLVTALESREHRERGVDAGANAYIVKSSFDQSNLLEVVRRLL